MSDCGSRHSCEKGCHLAARVTLGEALEVLASRIHQGHDNRRQLFSEHQRGGHRQRCDDIKAYLPAAEFEDNLDQERQQHRDGKGTPDPRRPFLLPEQTEGKAEGESRR